MNADKKQSANVVLSAVSTMKACGDWLIVLAPFGFGRLATGGQGAQAWTNYWFTPKNRLQFNLRHQKVSQEFLPGGGTLTDAGVRADYWVRSSLSLSTSVQYERWLFPQIQPNPQTNVSASVEILFQPEKLFYRSTANESRGVQNGGRP